MSNNRYFKNDLIYHIFNKSIAGFKIFINYYDYNRFLYSLKFYNQTPLLYLSLSSYLKKHSLTKVYLLPDQRPNQIVYFLAYCLMPDHYHLLVKIKKAPLFSKFVANFENSHTRYLNLKIKRKGPLWQSTFKAVRVKNEVQFLHLSRYIHLNPTSSNLVNDPQNWPYSSYHELLKFPYLLNQNLKEYSITKIEDYHKFVEERKQYQKKLTQIKKLLLE